MSVEWKTTGIWVDTDQAADAAEAANVMGSVVAVKAVDTQAQSGGPIGARACSGVRAFASLAALGSLAVLGLVGAAPSASAHTAGVAIPPESDYMVRWHQPHSVRPVDDWEIEVTPARNPAARFIATAQVMPEASCWALNVPIAEPATVRIRSVVGTQVSSWTRATVVPEPDLVAGMASGVGALALAARRVRRRARAR